MTSLLDSHRLCASDVLSVVGRESQRHGEQQPPSAQSRPNAGRGALNTGHTYDRQRASTALQVVQYTSIQTAHC